MKRIILLLLLGILALPLWSQSVSESTIIKRENRRGMTVKEWNTPAGSKQAFLDHVTTYDSLGRKIEEIEYASYGQKSRVVSEYPPNSDITAKVLREIEYNDRDRVVRIRKFEYDADGSKKRQLNYYPNGKLESIKEYEYIAK
jgi:antitoxin component YwqK of YwqJK toxin-antitoxin module